MNEQLNPPAIPEQAANPTGEEGDFSLKAYFFSLALNDVRAALVTQFGPSILPGEAPGAGQAASQPDQS